ncbi:MAG: fructose-1,6-bisphosphatase [Muribaculaceae bacterium]|nr:fructose-1,6-bisphosphatase [Muribaculaceae bacterium]MDE6446840.1 fructose-1,6-bisphosphatase [Muribaculaceae bacterium]MDE7343764.1 fructose-1,6-bisphosphatase [Muribaculaceae bacterium]
MNTHNDADRRVLELLSQSFGNASAAATEIINLEAILNLPKGTEHFVADIHGEHEAFSHILKNASGNIRRKVRELFATSMREEEIRQLCSLIYYPGRKLEYMKTTEPHLRDFYCITLHRLVKVLQEVSSKYTRSKVRKALPKEFAYIIEELLHEAPSGENKQLYYTRIVETIISTGQADSFIKAICRVIQSLSIDQLHILGDIYDRGPGAHLILDLLMNYKDYDIQWGNHDALWMGAAAGNESCIANAIRICLRYGNMETLEDGYGINLVPLATFAMEVYGEDPCEVFSPKLSPGSSALTLKSRRLTAKMHKAISVIQWKLEAELIRRHPEWNMSDRRLLHQIDFNAGTVEIDGKSYKLLDYNFPTIDPSDPYALTAEERELITKLVHSFQVSDKLKSHMHIFLSHGGIYGIYNSNLLFHASIPLNADGTLKEVAVLDEMLSGKNLLKKVESLMRSAFDPDSTPEMREYARDYYFYVWCGPDSPLFDKAKMATFERYLLKEKVPQHEEKGFYYHMRDDEKVCDMILDAFGVKGEHRHIINGHVPVKAGKGENPIKANGKMMVIDGGFSKAYHNTTGIAGYTLVFHSRGFELVQHEPFTSAEEAVKNGTDILDTTQIVELNHQRLLVRDTDKGAELQSQINELRELLRAYRHGTLKEKK